MAAILPLLRAPLLPLAFAGTAISAVGAIGQGEAAQSAANYNAQMARYVASEKTQQAKTEAQKLSDQRRQSIGRQVALYGASGVDPNSGSPLDVMANTATEYERDIQYAGISAQQATQEGAMQASIDTMQGRQAMMAGWMGGIGGAASGFGMDYYLASKLPRGLGS